jgi:hypothetical protein
MAVMRRRSKGFDFTAAIRDVAADMTARLPELSHIDLARVAIGVCRTRNRADHGVYAMLIPLRPAASAPPLTRGGRPYRVQPVVDAGGEELLYLVNFYLPRFLNLSLEEKLSTVVHELWHISPRFDGDLRRHAGRYWAHGASQREYDAAMDRLAQRWLAADPPAHLYEFLALPFAALEAEHGRIRGQHWPAPKLIPA